MSQTLPWWLGVRRGKDDRKQNTLSTLEIMFSKASVFTPDAKQTFLSSQSTRSWQMSTKDNFSCTIVQCTTTYTLQFELFQISYFNK
jgi:hypothetical protein